MSKFISVGGMRPSGGEGEMNSRKAAPMPEPTEEQLKARFGEYYKSRGDTMTSAFADVGDQFKFRGDNAIVRHVEKEHDGSQSLTVQRSTQGDSGTYVVKVQPDNQRSQVVTEVKRSSSA